MCIEFGPVRHDSVRGGPPLDQIPPAVHAVMDFYQGYCDCLLPFAPLSSGCVGWGANCWLLGRP